MEEPQVLFCACGRDFYTPGALANHRRSCAGAKRKVESALQGMNPEKWKKRKSTASRSLTVNSNTQVYSEPGPSHGIGTSDAPESIAATPDIRVEVCDAKLKALSTSDLKTDIMFQTQPAPLELENLPSSVPLAEPATVPELVSYLTDIEIAAS